MAGRGEAVISGRVRKGSKGCWRASNHSNSQQILGFSDLGSPSHHTNLKGSRVVGYKGDSRVGVRVSIRVKGGGPVLSRVLRNNLAS